MIRFLPIRKPWENPLYAYALPTYKQARRVAWRPLLRLIPRDWIKGEPHESEMRIETVFGSELYVVGMDKPQRIEGDQWDGIVLDESCDQKPGVFNLSVMPALTHRNGWCMRIGVPKRQGVGADDFKQFCLKGSTPGSGEEHEHYTWSSEDILTLAQLQWAKENYDPRDYNEQFKATWETSSGLVFYAYHNVLNEKAVSYDKTKPLIIGSDFNVDPMAWVIAQQSDDKRELYVLDELWLRNTNTREALTYLHSRYGSHEAGFDFFGDATSRARNTRATESDYVQIKNDKRFKNAKIHYPKGNPLKANRFSACNAMFCNASDQRRCFTHPRCKNLARDLTTRAYAPGTNEVADHDDIGHITDALGYIIYKLYPLRVELPEGVSTGVYVNA
jgi:hypothetical protein